MSNAADHRAADEIAYHAGPAPEGPAQGRAGEEERAVALEGIAHGMTLPNAEDVRVGTPGCQHCEVLPVPIRGPGTLRLRFPHTYTLGKILDFLARSTWEHKDEGDTLTVRAPAGDVAPLLSALLDRLSSPEQRDTRASFLPDGVLPQAADPPDIESLPRFAAHARAAWLLDVLREKRLYSVFQPILHCGGADAAPGGPPSALLGHECLMRANVDGRTVTPGPILDMARGADLIFHLDLAARRAALVGAAQHALPAKIFVNFSPNSIYNPYSCLDSTVRMIDELGLGRDRVVFEIVESERLPEMSHLERIVGYYRENGFGVALDDFGSGYSSMDVLLALRPDYVKLDRALISCVDKDPDQALVAGKLLEAAQGLGLKTVAEGVERREEWDWARSCGVDFVQGYLFARPAVPPPAWGVVK